MSGPDTNQTTLPGDFIDGLRHAADEDEAAGHSLQADYMRKAADEIERLRSELDTARRVVEVAASYRDWAFGGELTPQHKMELIEAMDAYEEVVSERP